MIPKKSKTVVVSARKLSIGTLYEVRVKCLFDHLREKEKGEEKL